MDTSKFGTVTPTTAATTGTAQTAPAAQATVNAGATKAPLKFDKFLEKLGDDNLDIKNTTLEKESLLDERTTNLLKNAKDHADVNGTADSFNKTGKVDTKEIKRLVGDKKWYTEQIEEAKKSGSSAKTYEDALKKVEDKLTKQVSKLESNMQDHVSLFDNAVKAADEGREKMIKQLQKRFEAEEKAILQGGGTEEAKAASIGKLRGRLEFGLEKIHEAHTDLVRDVKSERVSTLESIAKDIKGETGLEINIHGKALSSASKVAGEAEKGLGSLGELKKYAGKNKVLAGVIGVGAVYGLYKALGFGKDSPVGQELNGYGQAAGRGVA